MKESLIILLTAFVLDLYIGDPVYALHPVRLIGRLIQAMELLLEKTRFMTRFGGFVLLFLVQGLLISVYSLLHFLLTGYGILLNFFILYSCISVKDLVKHGKAVMIALEAGNMENARSAVQMLIGRDAKTLDSQGIARAAVESLAENFVDGFLAPLFWFTTGCLLAEIIGFPTAMGGVLLVLFYRTTNTLDSMVGYKNERYLEFGRASAKTDDILNFLPSRLCIPIITLAALLCKLDVLKTWSLGWRDRLKHSSPNAGHAEAAFAGALHIKLNGPGIYPHGKVDKPWLGEGTDQASAQHIKQASYLVYSAAFLSFGLFATILLIT